MKFSSVNRTKNAALIPCNETLFGFYRGMQAGGPAPILNDASFELSIDSIAPSFTR